MMHQGIRFGCQLYTWQMSGRYHGRLDHIAGVVRRAGFVGIEPEVGMLCDYADPSRLHDLLTTEGLTLGALTLVADWRQPAETIEETAVADATLAILEHFPGTLLVLCQMPGDDRIDLRQRQDNALACIEAVARRAAALGIPSAFHPNSPAGSVFRTAADYALLLSELRRRGLGFAADTGHLLKGGMDPQAVIADAVDLMRHIHFKDIDRAGNWVGMGEGVTRFPDLVRQLAAADYRGWIMVEEESPAAEHDPDDATRRNGDYLRTVLGAALAARAIGH